MTYEEFRQDCNQRTVTERCRIRPNPFSFGLMACTSDPKICPQWFLRESILKEIGENENANS